MKTYLLHTKYQDEKIEQQRQSFLNAMDDATSQDWKVYLMCMGLIALVPLLNSIGLEKIGEFLR